jgi:NO-binding membrane sensor protein with MHYT domain/nitrogen-specific signal transduction histidine kinase
MSHGIAMHGTYDPLLVGLSLMIAVAASFAALKIAGRLRAVDGQGHFLWLCAAAVALGGGIWSMHFVAMLAFSVGVPMQYDIGLTLASMVAAIVATGIAFHIVSRCGRSWNWLLTAGTFAGIGVATMHYMGMAAMQVNVAISYDPVLFVASVLVAVMAATSALWLAFNLDSLWHKVVAAFVMGAAIGGMHYTGMAATTFTRLPGEAATIASTISPNVLAIAIAAASMAILGLGIAAALVDRRFTGQLRRELIERRRIEIELRETNRNLAAAMEKLSGTERLATIGQIAATVGHELRNPLASIKSSMELVRKRMTAAEPTLERAFARIERGTQRCVGIVAELLNFARKSELVREPTSFDQWLAEILDEHSLPSGISLERDCRATEEIPIDREKFRQVIVNLIDNAAQAMTSPDWQPAVGWARRITVRTEAAAPGLRLWVIDNGPGMAAETLARIFEPLFTTKSYGIGLGMPLVQQIVESHNGTITVDSSAGTGTTVQIWLPQPVAIKGARCEQQSALAA